MPTPLDGVGLLKPSHVPAWDGSFSVCGMIISMYSISRGHDLCTTILMVFRSFFLSTRVNVSPFISPSQRLCFLASYLIQRSVFSILAEIKHVLVHVTFPDF